MMIDKTEKYSKTGLFYPKLRMKEYKIRHIDQVKIGMILRYKNGNSRRYVTDITDGVYTLDDMSRTSLAAFKYTESEIMDKFVEVRYLDYSEKFLVKNINDISDLFADRYDDDSQHNKLLVSNNGDIYQIRFLKMNSDYTKYTGEVHLIRDAETYKDTMDAIDFETIKKEFRIITNAKYI